MITTMIKLIKNNYLFNNKSIASRKKVKPKKNLKQILKRVHIFKNNFLNSEHTLTVKGSSIFDFRQFSTLPDKNNYQDFDSYTDELNKSDSDIDDKDNIKNNIVHVTDVLKKKSNKVLAPLDYSSIASNTLLIVRCETLPADIVMAFCTLFNNNREIHSGLPLSSSEILTVFDDIWHIQSEYDRVPLKLYKEILTSAGLDFSRFICFVYTIPFFLYKYEKDPIGVVITNLSKFDSLKFKNFYESNLLTLNNQETLGKLKSGEFDRKIVTKKRLDVIFGLKRDSFKKFILLIEDINSQSD